MKNKLKYFFFVIVFIAFAGCKGNGEKELDAPTYGSITIAVDETFKPIIEAEINTFESIYKDAKITANYKSQEESMADLINDKARFAVVTRKLNKEEEKYFKDVEIVPHTVKIAYDAVALIGNKNMKDSLLLYNDLPKLLTGEEVKGFKNFKIVFDNANSGTVSYLKKITGVTTLSKNCYALASNEAVIDYVAKQKDAIGIIGVNWISDRDDSVSNNFLSTVKVLEIAPPDTSEFAGKYYKPYQAYIAQKAYPLYREVYVISREARSGLGSGLLAFIAGDKGQRIILKSGLVPATMPVRLVKIVNENFKIIN